MLELFYFLKGRVNTARSVSQKETCSFWGRSPTLLRFFVSGPTFRLACQFPSTAASENALPAPQLPPRGGTVRAETPRPARRRSDPPKQLVGDPVPEAPRRTTSGATFRSTLENSFEKRSPEGFGRRLLDTGRGDFLTKKQKKIKEARQ